MTKATFSRVKYLKLALQEAHKAGDEQSVKRLTVLLAKIIEGANANLAQARAG
jgi:hypothetical protein